MWIVRLALRRPYTFVVMAVLIAILGGTAIVTMPVDIFPYIDIPIVSVVWPYYGLSPEEMEKRVVTNFERNLTSGVNDIEHIESQSYKDIAVVRVYFHPNVQIDMAVAQVTAQMQSALRTMPPGMFPANVLKYDAGSVPILKLGLSSKTLREQEIFDLGQNFIRTPLATVQGAAVSYPFGGKNRAVMVDLNPGPALRETAFADRCLERPEPAEPDPAGGHGETGGDRVSDQGQQQPAGRRRIEQPADQDGERRNGLHEGCGAGPGRLLRPEQYCPHGRNPRRDVERHPDRQSLHAGRGRRRQSRSSQDSRHGSAGAEGDDARRPVDLRARLDSRRDSRGPDRSRA